MKRALIAAGLVLVLNGAGTAAPGVELPGHYFRLMEDAVTSLHGKADLTANNGAMLAAAVLYKKQHPANPSFGDKKNLELALKLGDLAAAASEKDAAENRQDYEWEIHFWLDTYRLLNAEMGIDRRTVWRKQIEKNVRWFARETAGRIDFPRYQGPYIRTSTNHLALFASTTYLAGRVLANKEWETLGARALHRLAAEEQTEDGYWGEFTDNGPATGYNYITMCCVALYWEHSRDTAALEALRRATDFHKNFTWPDGTPVETINGRNRHWAVSAWGHFGFTHWPDGRRYAAFLAEFFTKGKVSNRDMGRLAQSALYCHEGPTEAIPQDLPRSAYQMKRVNAGIRKTGPWTVCLSGLIDAPIESQFTLDRQGHLSIYHERLGLIVIGANSKKQPELATFVDRAKDRVTTIPLSSRLRMADDRDRLGLGYHTFFAEAEVATPTPNRLPFRFTVTETGPGRLRDAQLNLQLCLKAGEVLETATTKIELGEKRVELDSDQIGGWIRHRGWTLRVDPGARLTWPVYTFDPYRNANDMSLRRAVGALSVPVRVKPPVGSNLTWRTQEIGFALEVNADGGDKPAGHAPDAELPGDRAIRKYLAARSAEIERDLLPGLKTAADIEKARPALRADFLDMLGLNPLPERTPLKATVTGRIERDGYTVENLHFQSRPGLYVTANLYLPRPAQKRSPAILYQSGHASQLKRDGNKADANHQSHAIWFATHGYVTLVLDTLELGEISAVHRGTLGQGRWWWYSAGYTPAGVECWNAIRAVDYLVSRPEVDPDRIGATGISGGGIGTFWLAAADERIKASAPISGMSDLTFYAGEGGIGRHCDCFFFPNRARWHWTTIAALIAPRPLFFVNSDRDVYFPMSGNDRVANRLGRLYSLFEAGDQAPAMVSVGGHGYRTDIRRAEFEFFNRHFKGDGRRVKDADAAEAPRGQFPITPRELRVFPTDADLPKDQTNTKIDEGFVARARPGLPAPEAFGTWKTDLLDRLSKASFAAWPAKAPEAVMPKLGDQPQDGRETTEDGIEVYWRWRPGQDAASAPWLIVLNPGEELGQVPAWARDLVGRGSALILAPRGVGPGAWARDIFPNTVERSFPLLGGTSDGGRVWDVLTVARRHARQPIGWRAAGQGAAGLVAAYAALYEPAITEVVAVNPPPSHLPRSAGAAYGPVLLNVVRVLDVPDALGCLAPRRLVLVGGTDAAFDRTAALYRAAGAADRLDRRPAAAAK